MLEGMEDSLTFWENTQDTRVRRSAGIPGPQIQRIEKGYKGVKYENTLSPQVHPTIWENAYKSAGPADMREDLRTFDANLRCTPFSIQTYVY